MITERQGFSFAMPIVIVGVIITLAGIASIFENVIFSIPLICIGIMIWSSSYGTQIDQEQNLFREFGSQVGYKIGIWKPLDKMPYLTIRKGKSGMTIYSKSNRATTNYDECFEVCLLSATHRTKVVVQKFKTKELAEKYAEDISKKLRKPLTVYNPAGTEKDKPLS